MLLELAGEADFVAWWKRKVGHNFLGLCPDDRPRDMFLIDVCLYSYCTLVVDAVDLAQAAGDLELGDCAQGDQTFCCGDEQLAKDVGHPAVRLRQLDSDVVVFVTLSVGRDLYAVKGNLKGEAYDLGGKTQQCRLLPVDPDHDRGRAGYVVIADVLDKGDLLQHVPHLLGDSAQDVEIVPHNLNIDRRSGGGSLLLLGDADLGARNVLDSLSDLFHGLRGRLDSVLNVIELDTDVIWRVALKDGATSSDCYCPGVDVLDISHIGKSYDPLAIAQDMIFFLAIAIIALGWISVWWCQGLARAFAQGHLHLPGDSVRVLQISPFRHVQVYVNVMRVYIREELDRLFKADLVEPDHGHGNDSQEGHSQYGYAVVEGAI